jgi:thiamine biosynthesis lipoprotein ApbE
MSNEVFMSRCVLKNTARTQITLRPFATTRRAQSFVRLRIAALLGHIALFAVIAATSHAASAEQKAELSSTGQERFEYAQLHMGVQVRLVVYAPDQPTAARACIAAYKRIAQLEQITSDYRPDSEVMRLCARSKQWVRVSPELFLILRRAQELSRRSGGAFDITVGPYVALWRDTRKTGVFPSREDLQPLHRTVGWRKIQLDPKMQSVRLLESGMKLDLGGIAKGYAGDEALRVLKSHWRVARDVSKPEATS